MKHEEREVRQIYNDYGDDLYRLCYFYIGNVLSGCRYATLGEGAMRALRLKTR